MTVRESDLRARLRGEDDEDVYATLVQCFEPVWDSSFVPAWVPRAELRIDPEPAPDPAEPEAAAGPSLRDRLIGLANEAQRAWRGHRFRRRPASRA